MNNYSIKQYAGAYVGVWYARKNNQNQSLTIYNEKYALLFLTCWNFCNFKAA